jgi:hypothetical protein
MKFATGEFFWVLLTHSSVGWNRTTITDTSHGHLERNSLNVYPSGICREEGNAHFIPLGRLFKANKRCFRAVSSRNSTPTVGTDFDQISYRSSPRRFYCAYEDTESFLHSRVGTRVADTPELLRPGLVSQLFMVESPSKIAQ